MKKYLVVNYIKKNVVNFASLIGLLILGITYYIVMDGEVTPYNIKVILNQVVIVSIIATGAIFIYTMGAFDISLGASTAVSAMMGAVVYNKSNSVFLMFMTCILVAVLIGIFNSLLAALFHLPVFVTTVAMLSILNSLIEVILNGQARLEIPSEVVKPLDTVGFKVLLLIVFSGLCIIMFNYISVGRQSKFIGGNPICAKQTGISVARLSIIAFAITGLGVGIGSFLTIVRAPVLSKTTASSIGMDVLIAIVFGGMPISGGARSKITAALIGALSMSLLDQILPFFGLSSGVCQLVKSILFLVVVFWASLGQKEKLLPR